jgi:tetratricopeptide (TPR) repeat protein
LRLDPNDTLFLYWLAGQLSPEEVIAFVETRLDDQPILVEWHRVYQSQMEQAHPETDLRPRYRKLVTDTKGQADALYLLGRADPDLDEDEKLCRQAASADPPSGFACYSLGFRALSQARFGEARGWFEKALPLLTEKTLARQMHYDALLANGDYDPLLQVLQTDAQVPGRKLTATMQMIRVHAIRGDKAKAQQTLAEAVQISTADQRNETRKALESMVCCCTKDVDGYLKSLGDTPSFAAAFLRGQLKEAAELATLDRQDASTCHGLLYLEASRSGAKDLAETQWDALLADLKKGGREEKRFAEILASGKPPTVPLPQRLAIEPTKKRVLLAVLAQRQPDQAAEMLALAKKLDFQHDALSLCLGKVWKQP